MGAGRKTSTSTYDSAGSPRRAPIPPDRDLRDALGGVIFGATASTIKGAACERVCDSALVCAAACVARARTPLVG
jgi:hypothetical protein